VGQCFQSGVVSLGTLNDPGPLHSRDRRSRYGAGQLCILLGERSAIEAAPQDENATSPTIEREGYSDRGAYTCMHATGELHAS
jgi:hypothetical protein